LASDCRTKYINLDFALTPRRYEMTASGSEYAPPLKRSWRLAVAVPSSLVTDVPHLREKTGRLGFLGRAFGIFRVDEVLIYEDVHGGESASQGRFIASVLGYMETPQHLRRHLIHLNPDLRFVGILPPLRTPNHPVSARLADLKLGETREGVVIESSTEISRVDVGVGSLAEVPARLHRGSRVTVQIKRTSPKINAELLDRNRIDIYWGFRVTLKNLPLGRLIQENKPDVVIAMSRLGERVDTVLEQLRASITGASSVLLAFGSPKRGLHEIIAQEGMKLSRLATHTVNFVPHQGTQTVRTEEAVYSTLALLNTIGG
jgi:predicted SPOUT superfamily RNA methylase MTH1